MELTEAEAESLAWSNADIEFSSCSNANTADNSATVDDDAVISNHNELQAEFDNVATQIKDLCVIDKKMVDLQQTENESLSKFVMEDDASICMYTFFFLILFNRYNLLS